MVLSIDGLWGEIEAWLQAHAPATFGALSPPAGDDVLGDLAARLGLALPAELVASLRRHNGADNSRVGPGFSFPGDFHLLDADGIVAQASVGKRLLEHDDDVRGR
ncbi:hypothetical protein DFJ67_0245 [Asanoa ferruginea]|uniref:Knr4/Smi1-like domain-containing protein n=1 Tax=Asanoa ferruginea TaxID=53367 RepID=A0A3D9ZA85_9ACTN|nr:hypothetical protein [Asanoa ferruginea]REF94328.1 hypothetical protein DFJ67_0245 [Asanoa ferruginea]GIF52306.1 hypothetical protein Afe04nite_68450 [Asanoa ferruginea]